jgi:mono/diheme cytochrome c family protein
MRQDTGFSTIAVALCVGALLEALLTGCAPSAARTDLQAVAQGRQLYHTLACDSCHGLDAVNSKLTYAPTHNHLRATAEQRIYAPNYTGKAKTAAEYIRESIVDPKAYVVDGYTHLRFGMPSFAYLSEREVNALVQFLYQQE